MSVFAMVLGAIASTLSPLNSADDRGVFVFGHLLIDLKRELEVYWSRSRVKDCGTVDAYCINGDIVNIVLPKVCAPVKVGSRWRTGGLETIVLAKTSLKDPHYPTYVQEAFYVHTTQRPNVVYQYSPRKGVTRIFYDVSGKTDFVSMAKSGLMDAYYQDAIRDPTKHNVVMDLITLDTLGECHSSGTRSAGARRDSQRLPTP